MAGYVIPSEYKQHSDPGVPTKARIEDQAAPKEPVVYHQFFIPPDIGKTRATLLPQAQVYPEGGTGVMALATARPRMPDPAKLLDLTDPVLSPAGIVANLGMDLAVEQAWTKFLTEEAGKAVNGVAFRKVVMERARDEKMDAALRRAVMQRALAYWRGQSVEKALYIGPRGGKWQDAKHTIPWKETKGKMRGAAATPIAQGVKLKTGMRIKGMYADKPFTGVVKLVRQVQDDPRGIPTRGEATIEVDDPKTLAGVFGDPEGRELLFPALNLKYELEDSRFGPPAKAKKTKQEIKKKLRELLKKDPQQVVGAAHAAGLEWIDMLGATRHIDLITEAIFNTQESKDAKKSMALVIDLSKAQARGGKYHRRVPRPGGGYHYIYEPEKYGARKDAHLDGEGAGKAYLSDRIARFLAGAGAKGLVPDDLADLVKKHGAKRVAQTLRDGVKGGKLTHKKGRFYGKREPA